MKFSALTWNIHGVRHITKTDFSTIEPILSTIRTDVICLQEVGEAKKKIEAIEPLRDFVKIYSKRGFNNNFILSRFPIIRSDDFEFETTSTSSSENALWCDVDVSGSRVRIYNCHFSIINAGPSTREQQLLSIVTHANLHKGPVIICGDLNTTIPAKGLPRTLVQIFHSEPTSTMTVDGKDFECDERYALVRVAERHGFREAVDIRRATWCVHPFSWELFRLKLDWFLVRGLDTDEVHMYPYITDHRAIRVDCVLPV